MLPNLSLTDPLLSSLMEEETDRQQCELELIASENYVSPAVLEATGSCLTNKYSEGLPGKRYYGGNHTIDKIEQLAIDRAKALFQAEHANVQPHSGSNANLAVYFALCKPGDTILAMDLAHGGHLTHGSRVNFSGKWFNIVSYGVDPATHCVDINQVAELAKQHEPRFIIAGGSAYPRVLDFAAFADIARETNAYFLADMAHIAGLVAAGLHPSPVPHADVVSSTTHKTLRGPRAGFLLCKQNDHLDPAGKPLAEKIDRAVFPGIQGGPLNHVIAGKAVAFHEAMQPSFVTYQEQTIRHAQAMSETFLEEGGRVLSGGTDTHLLLLDVTPWKMTGKIAEQTLEAIGLSVNKNLIPFDSRPPNDPSGVRLGTPAITTRGLTETECRELARLIARVLKNPSADERLRAKTRVQELASAHPIPV